jgi:hypothetical protein
MIDCLIDGLQGYEGSLLKVTSKNGKTASPVGFVTFNSRAGAEAAKQDLQVGTKTQAALIKKTIKFSSYIGKFRVEQLQSHI